MGVNRRSYYRILHVQPDAPDPVITASYRAMMSKLRLHPDKGGDPAAAALLNEAYAVLRDPAKRRQYDLQRGLATSPARTRQGPPAAPAAAASTRAPARPAAGPAHCPFCAAPAPAPIQARTRCVRCASPLAPPPARPPERSELVGRRAAPRMTRIDAVSLMTDWQQPARTASLADFSLTGIRLVTDIKIERQRIIRITGPLFDVLAGVVGCRSDGRRFEVHAAVVHALFTHPKGVVVSVSA